MTNEWLDDSPSCISITAVGVQFGASVSFEEWEQHFAVSCQTSAIMRWAIGDLLAYGEVAWPDKYSQAMEATGIPAERLHQYAWVSRNVPLSVRTDALSWSHHERVTVLETAAQKEVLQAAAAGAWSVSAVREEVAKRQGKTTPKEPAKYFCPHCGAEIVK